jgi:hypothetical protein
MIWASGGSSTSAPLTRPRPRPQPTTKSPAGWKINYLLDLEVKVFPRIEPGFEELGQPVSTPVAFFFGPLWVVRQVPLAAGVIEPEKRFEVSSVERVIGLANEPQLLFVIHCAPVSRDTAECFPCDSDDGRGGRPLRCCFRLTAQVRVGAERTSAFHAKQQSRPDGLRETSGYSRSPTASRASCFVLYSQPSTTSPSRSL